jgi:hypothetical protein
VRSITFPYTRFGGRFAPIIPITLFSQRLIFKTEAYVDSGAFCSIFQSEILESLQLPKERAQRRMLRPLTAILYPRISSDCLFRLPIFVFVLRLHFQTSSRSVLTYWEGKRSSLPLKRSHSTRGKRKSFSVIRTDNRCLVAVSRCRAT